MGKKLVLIDGHSILNRAFFGLPDLTNSEGVHTGAVYGFLNILFRILEEEKPDYLTVAFDVHAPTFRHKMFDGYKGTRKPMQEELRQQVPLMKEMLRAMGVTIVEKEGYEADDILGTLSRRAEQEGMEVSVISGDRDLLQLATEHVRIRIPKTKKTGTEIENYYAADVLKTYHVTPGEFIEVKALMGDTADNIPGVPGIGEKTATALIEKYKSIEAVHEDAENVKPPRASKNIVEFWEQAVMSKKLATIDVEAPVEWDFQDAELSGGIAGLYTEEAFVLCRRLEFKNLLGRFGQEPSKGMDEIRFVRVTGQREAERIWKKAEGKEAAFSVWERSKPKKAQEEPDGQLSLFSMTGNDDNTDSGSRLLGVGLSFGPDENYYFDFSGDLDPEWILRELAEKKERIYTFDLKKALRYLPLSPEARSSKEWEQYLRKRENCCDVMVAAYLLNPLSGNYSYEDVAKDALQMILPSPKELLGKRTPEGLADEEPEKAAALACYEACVAKEAGPKLLEKLKEKEMEKLFWEIEMPVVFVLYDMEKEGIRMDAGELSAYGKKLEASILELEKKIYQEAGEEFNINSPKQLGQILFEKLKLPNGKKTKTGYSTAADVLERLKNEYPIVGDILEYRQLAKLKSTYADGLIQFVGEDGRIHTTFHQTATATGRLSSTDPNLQNIPIRIELGKMIRKVFFPTGGNLFVDSDYSQIELRLLAHMSGDENLIEAFRENRDIHSATASQVFHVPPEEVTPLQRRNAKAVNFGIVYGISAYGLSQDLNVSQKEAKEFIDRYYEAYPGIKKYLEDTVKEAKEKGQIRTLFGRIRPMPELASGNFMTRQFGERVAMNAPIQGTAADIIKIAMIRVHDGIYRKGLRSRLILQIHDELLVDTCPEEKEQVIALLEEEMQNAVSLKVKMDVGTEIGYNWYEAH